MTKWLLGWALVLCGSQSLAAEVSVFRIGDLPLGHCTGFYQHDSGVMYTAGHCNHRKDFNILSQEGQLLASLTGADRSYLANLDGPYDSLMLTLSPEHEVQLKSLSKSIYSVPKEGFVIAGFPTAFRERSLSEFRCFPLEPDAPFSQRGLEEKLGIMHLLCPELNHLDEQVADQLTHGDLAGISGGPVFYNGELIGLAFHHGVIDQSQRGYIKVQRLDESRSRVLTEEQAFRYFQMDRRPFEEIKMPNVLLSDFSYMLRNNGIGQSRTEIQSIRYCEEEGLRILTESKVSVVPVNQVSIRFKRLTLDLEPEYLEIQPCDI